MTLVVEVQSGFPGPAYTCDPTGCGPRGRKLPGFHRGLENPLSPPLSAVPHLSNPSVRLLGS